MQEDNMITLMMIKLEPDLSFLHDDVDSKGVKQRSDSTALH